ncbi:hypothetical protein CDLVIII_0605 [Clostridium sp. DL-VIII]|uniref:hypothetical protein n=1 Tax=Clostridium sp. DL-VIII TaxID=641107 RepID=UPI00023AF5F0|nr:hypothetical protein [Clostridium sp. DL-VIII]EHI97334.1 hypothetical protein CDLVIII_0605 [Clostridium sp. DL-VIII]
MRTITSMKKLTNRFNIRNLITNIYVSRMKKINSKNIIKNSIANLDKIGFMNR